MQNTFPCDSSFYALFFLFKCFKKWAAATTAATTTEAGSMERAALAVDMEGLIYWGHIN
jgi:hypothetical protein